MGWECLLCGWEEVVVVQDGVAGTPMAPQPASAWHDDKGVHGARAQGNPGARRQARPGGMAKIEGGSGDAEGVVLNCGRRVPPKSGLEWHDDWKGDLDDER